MIYKRDDEAFWLDDLEPVNVDAHRFEPSPVLSLVDGPD